MFFIRILTVVYLTTFLAFPWGAAAPVRANGPTVVINEIFWMGSSASSADEWLELRNLTDQQVDISGWKLTKKSSGVETDMLVIPTGSTIPAQGYWLISNYSETHLSSTLATPPNLVDSDVALGNSALQVRLYNQTGTFIDSADDGSGNPLAGRYISADGVYWSMERNPVASDGTLAENWHTASRGQGFKNGRTERGTPGTMNSNGLPIAEAGPALAGVVGQAVNFDASDSVDPELQPLSYSWDFGDSATGSGATPSHTYAAAGEFSVTLSVSDGVDTSTDTQTVSISAAPAAAPSATPNPNAAPTNSTPKSSCRGVILNELWPNPAGADDGEFIEFFNPTTRVMSVAGCAVWLNEKRQYVFSEGTINPGQYIVLEKTVTKLSLTNTGGSLRWIDSDGTVLETIDYPKAPENESWARLKQQWSWTNRVTRAGKNLEPTDDENEGAKVSTTETSHAQTFSLADIQTLETGQLAKLQGVVTVPPDVLGSRTIYLEDDTGAVQALLAETATPPAAGDLVELVGTVRGYQGRKRLLVKAGDLRTVASGRLVEPKVVTADQLSADWADHLVAVAGVVSASTGAKILIDDGSGEIEVYIKSSTGIIKPKVTSGDRLVVTGVVNVTTAGIKILPRQIEDLRVERILGVSTKTGALPTSLPTTPPNQTIWYWVLVGAGILAASARPAWQAWKRNHPAEGGVEKRSF